MQINTPTVEQGGWMDPPTPLPRVFDTLQYFETILPSAESLWSSLQDEVYFMVGGTAGGPVTSSAMVANMFWTLQLACQEKEITLRHCFFSYISCLLISVLNLKCCFLAKLNAREACASAAP